MLPQAVMAATFPIAAVAWSRRLEPRSAIDALVGAWVALTVSIALTADVLSVFHRLGSPDAWACAGIVSILIPSATRLRAMPLVPILSRTAGAVRSGLGRSPLLLLMFSTIVLLGLANAVLIVATAPGTDDVLAYHLPKMGFAIQSGSFELPYANYWAQQVHPHNGTALLVYAFLVASGNDHWLPLWQYAAYWIAIACVAGLARESGASRRGAVFAGCVFGLLTNALMQSTTGGNDLLLSGHAAVAAIAIVRGVRRSYAAGLPLAGLSVGTALGTKALFLVVMPPLAWLLAVVWRRERRQERAVWRTRALAGIVGLTLMTFASGYVENVRRWGDPFLGPPEVRHQVSLAGQPFESRAANGTRNLARYVFDSLSADGLPRLRSVVAAQRIARAPLRRVTEAFGVDLETRDGTHATFTYDRLLSAHESHAFWGILGVLLIWPAAIRGIVFGRGLVRALAVAGLLVFPLQAYTSLYDPWRGRFFLLSAVFLAPLAAFLIEGRLRHYTHAAAVIGCASAVTAVLFRSNMPLVQTAYGGVEHRSVLSTDRIAQLTRDNKSMEDPVRTYERLVPHGAVVLMTLRPDTVEYAFFGDHLNRRLQPRPPHAPVPNTAWLLFDETTEEPAPGDVPIGAGFWLRRPVSDLRSAGGAG